MRGVVAQRQHGATSGLARAVARNATWRYGMVAMAWLDAGIFAVDELAGRVCEMANLNISTLMNASAQRCHLCHTRSGPLALHGASLSRSPASKPFISRPSRSRCIVQARRGEMDVCDVFNAELS